MEYEALLNRIIDDGIAAVREDYRDRELYWIEGGVAGFEACRGKLPNELRTLLDRARRTATTAYHHADLARYWRLTAYVAEVEWVCNVVSAALIGTDEPVIVQPTARGVIKAAEIIGHPCS